MPDGGDETPQSHGGNYAVSRLNAAKHGVLSQFRVLPSEDEQEYQNLLDELATEYHPEGQTERYFVEELAGIMWRKRRLRLAEFALHQDAMEGATDKFLRGPSRVTHDHPKPFAALSSRSKQQIAQCLEDVEAYRGQTLKALDLLKGFSYKKIYKQRVAALHGHTREWWEQQERPTEINENLPFGNRSFSGPSFYEDTWGLRDFLKTIVLPWCDRCQQLLENPSILNAKAFGNTFGYATDRLSRYEVSLDRKFERTLAMLLKLQQLRRDDRLDENVLPNC
jgi:hypothetical protein